MDGANNPNCKVIITKLSVVVCVCVYRSRACNILLYVPRKENLLKRFQYTLFLELERLGLNDGRVDQIHSETVRAELVHDVNRIRVIFQTLSW